MSAEEGARVIIDFLHPKAFGMNGREVDVVDADQSRRFYEVWSKKTYLIRDTVILEGEGAFNLFVDLGVLTSEAEPGTGWSGHEPSVAVTVFMDGKKALVTSFSFRSKSWIRREDGRPLRARINQPEKLRKLLEEHAKE